MGKGGKGSSWGKGKGTYSCEDDCWYAWSPQMLLSLRNAVPVVPQAFAASACPRKVVPVVDSEGYAAPKKTAAKKVAGHQTQVATNNRFFPLPGQ